jgi:cysteine-rich repeat protein
LANGAAGEDCDEIVQTATCDGDCTTPICGDALLNTLAGEECDHGGESGTCDDDCTPVDCGDGNWNATAGEDCDDGGESATCDDDCTPVECGDSNVNEAAGEECDDGNTANGDGCDANCIFEVPPGCRLTTIPNIVICISNNTVNTYATASHCAACTEKGLTNACIDNATCRQGYTNQIIEELYFERTGMTCTATANQGPSCGWGEIMTPDYQAAGICPTPQDCTSSLNWQNCTYGTGSYVAYIYGVCAMP